MRNVISAATSLVAMLAAGTAVSLSSPAYAAEVWECSITTVPDTLHKSATSGSVKFLIDGKTLNMQIQSPILRSDDPTLDILTKQGAFRYQVLDDNDVGIVAANSRSLLGTLGPLIGASIIVISKSNGDLHIGSVVQDGAHDLQVGHCALE
jgi:hypothetical protein